MPPKGQQPAGLGGGWWYRKTKVVKISCWGCCWDKCFDKKRVSHPLIQPSSFGQIWGWRTNKKKEKKEKKGRCVSRSQIFLPLHHATTYTLNIADILLDLQFLVYDSIVWKMMLIIALLVNVACWVMALLGGEEEQSDCSLKTSFDACLVVKRHNSFKYKTA